jgi:hypothetical protein
MIMKFFVGEHTSEVIRPGRIKRLARPFGPYVERKWTKNRVPFRNVTVEFVEIRQNLLEIRINGARKDSSEWPRGDDQGHCRRKLFDPRGSETPQRIGIPDERLSGHS